MSLIFSGISPHPPIIIPEIGGNDLKKAQKTISALKEMNGDLYVAQPEVILIISPHSQIMPEAYSLNLANEYVTNLKEFGYSKEEIKFKCEMELLSKIKESADEENIPVNIISQPKLDHGVAVPLYYLASHLEKIKIIPISFSLLNYESHYKFGKLLRKIILNSNKRIAIIASGDLSHRLTKDAPAGYSHDGMTFDNLLISYLEQNRSKEIMNINPQLIEGAGECGLRSIIILLGVLNGSNYQFKKLSYEGPFGVGYLVAELI
jgi:AmmeMemoRadiSam system protein B